MAALRLEKTATPGIYKRGWQRTRCARTLAQARAGEADKEAA